MSGIYIGRSVHVLKSKISQARHRVTSGVGGRIVNGYDNMPVYRLGDLPAGARYRTSDAVRIRGFNTSDTSPKYDKNSSGEVFIIRGAIQKSSL